jgi:polyhydroxyalkanoate synthesis regulator phasin
MFETLDKVMLAGLGALAMTKERAEKIFEDYVARGQAERGSRSGFVKEIMDNAEKARKEMEKLVSEQVQAAVKKLNLASQEDVHRLEKKLDKLLKQEP